jgi:hypothetical protein
MTIRAHIIQALKVGVLVAVKTGNLAMLAGQFDGVDTQVHFGPHLHRRMAVVTRQRNRYVVRAQVACITVGHLDIQVSLLVAIQTDAHRTEMLTRQGIESVAYSPMAVAAMHITGATLFEMGD